MKRNSVLLVIRETQVKTITYTLEWLELKQNKTEQVLAWIWSKWKWSFRQAITHNGTATLENGLKASYKVKLTLTIWRCNPSPRYLPTSNENLRLNKNLYAYAYSGFIFTITKTQKTSKCPFTSQRINRLAHLDNGILLSDKRNCIH